MSKYSVGDDETLVISDKTVIWNDSQYGRLQYVDASDSTLTDTIDESYATAIDENETQYLSVLETSDDMTLNDLQTIIERAKCAEDENAASAVENTQTDCGLEQNQVVVFTMEGSDDLYGLQVAEDEHGNVRKYQFKLGTTIDGQLEAIPDSIKLVEEEALKQPPEFVKQERPVETNFEFCQQDALEGEPPNDEVAEHPGDTDDSSLLAVYIKGESQSPAPADTPDFFRHFDDENEEVTLNYDDRSVDDVFEEKVLIKREKKERQATGAARIVDDHAHLVVDEASMRYINVTVRDPYRGEDQNLGEDGEQERQFVDGDHYEEIYVQENRIRERETTEEDESGCGPAAFGGDFAPAGTDHAPAASECAPDFILHEVTEKPTALEKTNILKRSSLCAVRDPRMRKSSDTVYYVVYPDKENVGGAATAPRKLTKTNPRSILKASVAPRIQTVITNTAIPTAGGGVDERFQKRFAKSKEAVEAKLFHNFINKTTVPQAPVRRGRLPRKQKIKPVGRRDDEIIVQEVVLSSDGVVESIADKLKHTDRLEVTAFVELTDSEDEGAATDAQTHVINSDGESEAEDRVNAGLAPVPEEPEESARGSVADKQEYACPNCPKTFPSRNSLHTHIHHHNLEDNLKKKKNKGRPTMEYKHKCDACEQTFKNVILLGKHACPKQKDAGTTRVCATCGKTFRDVSLFNIHKRSHAKSNLVRRTSVAKVSPKKTIASSSTSSSVGLKCAECGKLCDSESALKIHRSAHKKFACTTCTATFPSRVLLDAHKRTRCVKPRSPASFKIRKSSWSVRTPSPRSLSRSLGDGVLNRSVHGVKLACDRCEMKFGSYRVLYTHKVQSHGMDTPDKSLLATKPKASTRSTTVGGYAARSAHGGIPTNDRMKKAYAALRKKLAENAVALAAEEGDVAAAGPAC